MPPIDEADEGDDRQRHVQIEDLLDEALVGVVAAPRGRPWRGRPRGRGRSGARCSGGCWWPSWGRLRWAERPVSPRVGSRRPHNRSAGRSDRTKRASPATARSRRRQGRLRPAGPARRRAAAIISGTSRGSRISGASRSRARELVAIEEIRAPVTAIPRSSSSRTGISGSSPLPESRKKSAKIGHRDELQREQVDDQRRRLRQQQRRAVDRGEADRLEAALLALGDEDPVDREQRGEEDVTSSTPAARPPSSSVRSRPKRKIT